MNPLLTLLFVSVGLTTMATQDAPQRPPSKPNAPTTITLSGCVSRAPSSGGNFTFVDGSTGAEYRLTGRGISKFAGQKVEIVGGSGAKRLVIRGGLTPSPNIAGQASAIDPAQAAVASRPGGGSTGTGSVNLPEFRVNRVRAIEGACQ
jgi:hypothetical protein